jgi:hypothetical protein
MDMGSLIGIRHRKGITRFCPARETIIVDAILKSEEILRKIERQYPPNAAPKST